MADREFVDRFLAYSYATLLVRVRFDAGRVFSTPGAKKYSLPIPH